MKLFKGFLILASGVFITGCSKVINVELPTAAPKLVIDASIDWDKNTAGNEQRILLSTTTGYYSEQFPTVSGARINISNSAGTVFNFAETSHAGEYLCTDFKPAVGETYRLTVILNEAIYTATETFIGTPDLDTTISQNDKGGMTGDEIEVEFSFQDDGSQDNYYMSRVKTNRVAYPVFNLESDENYQGRKMTEFYSHEDLAKGDSVNIKLYGTSRRFYDYFKKVLAASGNNDSPFPTVPTAARGNIINQKNADDYPLGYFRLSQVVSRNYTIK
jgi:hypothetical protein